MNTATFGPWGVVSVSVLSLLIFAGCLVTAFFMNDPGLLNLVVGAAIANATTVVNFYLGSSAGSQKKDATLSAVAMPTPVATVTTTATDPAGETVTTTATDLVPPVVPPAGGDANRNAEGRP